jgi:uncharacterized protein
MKSMTSRFLPPKQVAIALLSLFVALTVARVEELPPAPKSYFNDYAGVISESKRHDLNERLAKFDKDTTNQVVIAIFQKMDSPLSLDEYTLRVVNSWGVGQRGKNNGVTLFVFIRDHTMRIQAGYGLTSVLTDALSKQILEQDLKSHFQKGDFDGGLAAGVDSILRIVGGQQSSEHAGQK